MKITKIFIDLDDVLNNFTLHALRHVGCPVEPWEFEKYDPEWGWDIVTAANELHPFRSFTPERFWSEITRDVWSTAPVGRQANTILEMCVDLVGRENICVLTSPTLDPECAAGKTEWIQSRLPRWLHRQYFIGPPKQFCASPGAVLIDDSDQNIKNFTANGGLGILVPRPWNTFRSADPDKALQYNFQTLRNIQSKRHELCSTL